ncbi:hypothetical protein LTR56_000697 [Elasticomyces elasticus]|uniref:Ribosome maturation protein SDO1/SBDS N-terminal domain-containing protein n=1 Tax=Elasticomyces elasticus TaxID=574655 RepID=A0AAN7WCQ4_9PEZI|nr:hypothetical protein LTR56_017995 [Elasticomyces elasticus]KAK3637196.1 hypothetical protein LTR22_018386 [Elasticomyces elasticus]KAK3647778.1 hypothetical protein LTR22_013615 [Elasticomyces elasticus]KAK3660321.1 hypothetical protein LTR56_000697 [Elasticomyces elasticus]KAK4914269.1 hypothetical protein LTR49_017512 [Elasticomyces elasticus]
MPAGGSNSQKGNGTVKMHKKGGVTKVHYKGKGGEKSSDHPEDFIVFVDSADELREWKKDSTKPLVEVVNSFDVFVTGKHGNQGEMNRASKGQLEAEFGTSRDDDVMKIILQQGNIIEGDSKEAGGNRNVANSGGSVRD